MDLTERTHWELDTPLSVDAVTDALVDFSPRRELVWRETCDPAVYRVHEVGPTWADVTEGVSFAWSRERYDWSVPGLVTLTQLEANIARPVGTIRYEITARPGGGSRIVCDRHRVFRGPRGMVLGMFMVLLGSHVLRAQFRAGLARVEAR